VDTYVEGECSLKNKDFSMAFIKSNLCLHVISFTIGTWRLLAHALSVAHRIHGDILFWSALWLGVFGH
jgi:hypothetical protein